MKMMMMIKKTFLLLIFIFLAGISFSQEDDFGVWVGLSAKYKLKNNLEADFSGCLRTFNNSSRIEQSFLEGGLQYSLNKYISFSGSYRLISKLEDNTKYYFRHKFFLDIKGKIPAGNFSFSARARVQRTTKTYIEDDEDLVSKYYSRMKFEAIYNIPGLPVNPYIYCEPFIPVFSDRRFTISKNRLSAGVELKVTRKTSLEAEYIFQRDYQPDMADEHIISINYTIRF
jgi:hypothetical protein